MSGVPESFRQIACAIGLILGSLGLLHADQPLLGESRIDLPDFSYAGYRMGAGLPDTQSRPRLNVLDFGAIPGDDKDDSAAFLSAITVASGSGRVVFVPHGIYDVDAPLNIDRGNWVLKGESRGGTILRIRHSLCEVNDDCEEIGRDGTISRYSFGPGFVHVSGGSYLDGRTFLSPVIEEASRGSSDLVLGFPSRVSGGDMVTVLLRNPPDNSLVRKLHANAYTSDNAEYANKALVRFASYVAKKTERTVTLERALPIDVKLNWKPEVYAFRPGAQEVGIENLSIVMPVTSYPGHFQEKGFNAITFSGVANSWIAGVTITNSDLGIHLSDSQFVTITDVDIEADPGRGKVSGHHAIWLSSSYDNLVSGFRVGVQSHARYHHDVSMSWYARGNVFEKGAGYDMNLDHHGAIPYQNLFTDLDLGLGRRPFESGGGKRRMPHSGSLNVFWALKARHFSYPPCSFGGGELVFVNTPGLGTRSGACVAENWYYGNDLQDIPGNLYRAQLEVRRNRRSSKQNSDNQE